MHIVTRVFRANEVESIHTGEAAVVDCTGKLLLHTTHPEYNVFARSTLKPFQALSVVSSGAAAVYRLSDEELAVVCGSHNGEPVHVDTVRNLLQRTGLTEEMLLCGAHKPLDESTADAVLARDVELTPIYNNCSGKHAGMLLAAKHQRMPPENYIQEDHPLQQQIRNLIGDLAGRSNFRAGIDGCSLPTYYLTLHEIAVLFQKLGENSNTHLEAIFHAMNASPYMVAGRNRFDTAIMEACPGTVISKIGAEGVRGMTVRHHGESYGIAVKALDGAWRGTAPMMLTILDSLGWIEAEVLAALSDYHRPHRKNHRGLDVGYITAEILE